MLCQTWIPVSAGMTTFSSGRHGLAYKSPCPTYQRGEKGRVSIITLSPAIEGEGVSGSPHSLSQRERKYANAPQIKNRKAENWKWKITGKTRNADPETRNVFILFRFTSPVSRLSCALCGECFRLDRLHLTREGINAKQNLRGKHETGCRMVGFFCNRAASG